MLKVIKESSEPSGKDVSPSNHGDAVKCVENRKNNSGALSFFKNIFRPAQDTTLRETIEEYVDDDSRDVIETSMSAHEKTLISNILELRDMCAADIMVPRADIIAINQKTTQEGLLLLLSERQYSRLPVYKGTLDNVIGSIHVKDIMATLALGKSLNILDIVREVPIVSPSIKMLDLLLQMRITKKHMVLVVDEFGGIDGLVTIGDVIESIVGEIDDEHDPNDHTEIIVDTDGTVTADARVDLDEFEEIFGQILSDEERNENDTLGGLVFSLAEHVPARGEIITHKSGMTFEIIEADPRRVKRLHIRNIPA
ncbi:MAG: magnesium/cobalt efflux protein [Zetaproteobacteria bacterium]|nr:MAG: magnesium/cobalt efflux protein [Zetaproteobacteria bacterium]